MNHDDYSDDYLRNILRSVHTIAMVGASERPNRPSHYVMAFLQAHGYRVIPVNPRAAVPKILGEKVYRCLAEIPEAIDMVDVFRRSEEAGAVVDDAIAKRAKVVWMQLGVRDDAAARKAEQAGIKVVMNRCPKIELTQLSGRVPA
ncbi:MAG TPA: CoA-binding protein [Stellaceae bacterium]|nr:CoA-binding protein [Stellaceae bacterium]